ncbi:unnamed protein product [Cunninghamella blakesleeana]
MTESETLTSSEPIIFQEQEVQQNEHNNQLPNHIELVLRKEKFVVEKYVLSSLPKNMIKLIFNNKLQQQSNKQSGTDSENENNDNTSNSSKSIIYVDFDPTYFRYILNTIKQIGQKRIDDDEDDNDKKEDKKLKIRYYSLKFLLYHMENKPDVYLYDTTIYNYMEKETFIVLREELNYYVLPLHQQQDKIKFIQSFKSKVGKVLVEETNILDPLLKKIKKDHPLFTTTTITDQQQKDKKNTREDSNNNNKVEEKEINNTNDNVNEHDEDDDSKDEIKEKEIIQQHHHQQRPFIDMLNDFHFNPTSQWGHRKLEPSKATILSISMVQLNSGGSLDERLDEGFKILHLKQKPATKCWWEMDKITMDDIQIKFWKRREWTLQLFSI